jgi:hypothetical protein
VSAAARRRAALAALKADIEHELTQALEIACEPLDERDPPARVAATHRLIDSYVNLSRIYIEKFEEIARDA